MTHLIASIVVPIALFTAWLGFQNLRQHFAQLPSRLRALCCGAAVVCIAGLVYLAASEDYEQKRLDGELLEYWSHQ